MQKLIQIAFILILGSELFAQPISPESIIWNEYTNTYIISDAGSGKLLSMNADGSYSDFTVGLNEPKGLVMGNFSLWATDKTEIVEINPLTGVINYTYQIAGSQFLNDIVIDDFGMLYISDSYAGKIFRMDELFGEVEVFSQGELIMPNGMYYDPLGGIIIVSFSDPAKIYTMDTEEGNVEELMQTSLGQLDGITFDTKRYVYYISSWKTNSIYTLEPAFIDPPELLQGGFEGPADIFYNEIADVIAVPSMNSGEISFISFESTDVNDNVSFANDLYLYPSPVKEYICFDFSSTFASDGDLKIFTITGKLVIERKITSRTHIDVSLLSPGQYIYMCKNKT